MSCDKNKLRVIVWKPSKYNRDGFVEMFWRGFMPNSTVYYIASMVPLDVDGVPTEVHSVDEYVEPNLKGLELLKNPGVDTVTLVLLVGVQSHQFHRALDLADFAVRHGSHAVIGGPHPMTCDTTMLQGRGVSFSLSEAELVLPTILHDALHGELQAVYGTEQRWQRELQSPVLIPPSKKIQRRYVDRSLGVYPARGCPYSCTFCSVIKISGQVVRTVPTETIIETLKRAKAAGVKHIVFTSDNFNKNPIVVELLEAMIAERINLSFFVQCDTQVVKQPELIRLLGRAGCRHMFLGFESFSRKILLEVHKTQNHPEDYPKIAQLCHKNSIQVHFSNMIGFRSQTEADIWEHLEKLMEVAPDVAWFYIVCMIPGTEDYKRYLSEGLITEPNLDRYDASCLVWKHPSISEQRIQEILLACYKRFYGIKGTQQRVKKLRAEGFGSAAWTRGMHRDSLLVRLALWQGMHPMAGGFLRRKLDHVDNYIKEREKRFGFRLVPLPQNLELSPEDEAFNRNKKLQLPVLEVGYG